MASFAAFSQMTLAEVMNLSPLLQNGIDATTNGIEDYQVATTSRATPRLSSAIRNVAAGVLLVAKEKLRRLSANEGEFLLYDRVAFRPASEGAQLVRAVPDGKKTVDVEGIRKRLADLGVPLPRWKEEVVRLTDIRNGVEHLLLTHPESAAREAIACATAFLRNLLALWQRAPTHGLRALRQRTLRARSVPRWSLLLVRSHE